MVLIDFSIVILNAKDYPLERKINLTISNHTTTVLEFPFKIVDKRFDPFKKITYVKKEKDNLQENSTIEAQVPQMKKKIIKIVDGKKVEVIVNDSKNEPEISKKSIKNNTPINITTSKDGNIMELKPNVTGKMKMIIWGYKNYPVMVNINIVEDDTSLVDYYKFVDFETPKNDLIAFESEKHEKVIVELLKNGYLNKTPSGYKKEITNTVIEDGKQKINLTTILNGKKYSLKIYDFINLSNIPMQLEERMFYQEGKVYAVSIEKINKILEPQEMTRVFVVEKKEG